MPRKAKRRKYFIDSKFQGDFIVKVAVVLSSALLLLVGVVIYASKDASAVRLVDGRVLAEGGFGFILPALLTTFIAVFLVSLIMVSYISLRTSHRISGPLYRLIQEINAVAEGDFTRSFRIRGNDQLQELSRVLGAMNASLKQKHNHTVEVFNALRRFLILKEFSLSRKDADQCILMLKEMQSALDKFKT